MFEEDDIVKYNGQYRVVEHVSSIGVHFKDCDKKTQFSFAPYKLVKKISPIEFWEDFMDASIQEEIFSKAIEKYIENL